MGLGGLGASIFSTAKAVILLDTSSVTSGVKAASGSVRSFSADTVALSRGFDVAGKAIGAVGGIIAVGLGQAANEFIKFNEKVQDIASLGTEAAASIGTLQPKLLDLASSMGKAPTDLADALYTVASAGFSVQDSFTIIKASTDAAVAGLTDVATAAGVISATLRAYGLEAKDAGKVTDILFAAVQVGRIRFEELARVLGVLSPTAKAAGVSLTEVAASLATLTNQGLSARQAANQLNSLFQSFIKPNRALAEALHQNGFESGQALLSAKGLGEALKFLGDVSGNSATNLTKLLGNQRAARAAFLLTGNAADDYSKNLQATTKAEREGGTTAAALAEQTKSSAFQIRQAKASMQALAITIGGGLAPVINKVAQLIKGFADGIRGLFTLFGPNVTKVVVTLALMVAGLLLSVAAMSTLSAATLRASESLALFNVSAARTAIASALAGSGSGFSKFVNIIKSLPKVVKLTIIVVGVAALFAQLDGIFHGTTNNISLDLESAGNKFIAVLGEGLSHLPVIGTDGVKDFAKSAQDGIEAQKFALKVGLKIDRGAFDDEVHFSLPQLGLSFEEIKKQAADAGQSVEDFILTLAKEKNVQVDLSGATGKTADAIKQQDQAEQEAEAQAKSTAAEYDSLAAVIDSLGKKVPKATAAFLEAKNNFGLTLPLSNNGEEFKNFTESLNSLVDKTKSSLGDIRSVEDPFSFLRSQIDKTQETISGLFLRMDDLGVGINFTSSERSALKLNANMELVDQKLAEVDKQVQGNAADMSLWQGRIDLVNNTLGDQTDTLSKYNEELLAGTITQKEYDSAISSGKAHRSFEELRKLREQGLITEKEYNDILAAGQDLIARSVGGLQDERIEQAKLIPLIDEYVKKHDQADQAIKNATNDQKAFIGLLKDQNTQQALGTVQLVSYLASIGQIPQSAVTKVVTDLGNSSPQLAALFTDLGLLKKTVTIEVQANIDAAQQRLLDIQTTRNALLANKAVLQVKVAADPGNTQLQAELKATQTSLDSLEHRKAALVGINLDDPDQVAKALNADDKALAAFDGTTVSATASVTLSADPAGAAAVITEFNSQIEQLQGQITPILTQAEADAQIAPINAAIANAKKVAKEGGFFVNPDTGIKIDVSTEAGKNEIAGFIESNSNKVIKIQAQVDADGSAARKNAALSAQIKGLEADAKAAQDSIDLENTTSGIQSLSEAQRQLQKALTDPTSTPKQLQEYNVQLERVTALLAQANAQGFDANVDPRGVALLNDVAKTLKTFSQPTVVQVLTPGEQKLAGLNTQIRTTQNELNGLLASPFKEGDETDKRIKLLQGELYDLGQTKTSLELILTSPEELNAQFQALDSEIAGKSGALNDIKLKVSIDESNVKSAQDNVNAIQQSLASAFDGQDTLSINSADGFNVALVDLKGPVADVTAQLKNFVALGYIPQSTLDSYTQYSDRLQTAQGDLSKLTDTANADQKTLTDLNTTVDVANNKKAAITLALSIQGTDEMKGILNKAQTTGEIGKATAQVQLVIDEASAQATIAKMKEIKGVTASVGKTGKIKIEAENTGQAIKAIREIYNQAKPTLDQFRQIEINVDGHKVSGAQLLLEEFHKKAIETFTPEYTAFLDVNADGVIDKTDLAAKNLENVATRWTAFIDANADNATVVIDFIAQRLADIGGQAGGKDNEIGFSIKANPDQLYAVIKGVNNKITDSHLNGNLLANLDANNDGFLSAVEIARVAAVNATTDPYIAALEIEVRGNKEAYAALNDTKDVVVSFSKDPSVITIVAKSDAEVKRFTDAHTKELAGKTLQVSIIGDDGIRKTEEYQFKPKEIKVTVNGEEFTKFKETSISATKDGLTYTIRANSVELANEVAAVNKEKLDGKTVRIEILDEYSHTFKTVEEKKFDKKNVPIVIQTPTGPEISNAVKDSTVPATLDTAPAIKDAAALPAQVQKTIDQQPAPAITVKTVLPPAQASASSPSAVGARGVSTTAAPIDFGTAGLQTQANAALAVISGYVLNVNTALSGLATAAGQNSTLTGQALVNGIIAGMVDAPARIAKEGIAPITLYFGTNLDTSFRDIWGASAGISFAYGIVEGINNGSGLIEQAAGYAAIRAYNAARAALQIKSPSQKGAELGSFFSLGIAQGILSQADRAALASRSVAERVADEFASVKIKPLTIAGAIRGQARPGLGDLTQGGIGIAARPGIAASETFGQTQNNQGGPVTIHVNGSGDPNAVANEVYRKLYAASNRFTVGGGAQA